MVNAIIRSSLKLRYLVVAIAVAMMVIGVIQIRNVPVDVLPEFTPPYIEIQTEALGLSAEEVESLITLGLEQDLLNGVPWLDTIRSESVSGLSSIVLVFKPGTDLNRARQMVSERLTQAFALPHVSKPPTMLQPLSATSRVMIVGLSSKTLSLIQMSVLARWTISPRLMGVPGVANVAIWGQRDRQLQVQVDPKRMQDHKVSLLQVLETAGNALWVSSLSFVEASTPGTGGFIDTNNQRLSIRHILPIVSSEGLAKVPIEDSSVQLGDVANVVEDHQPLIGDALTRDGASLMLVIEKFPGANAVEVTKGVEEALGQMSPGLPGMNIDSSLFRPADFIQMAIRNLATTLLIGFGLVLLILIAFLFNWRTVLISCVTIPLSVMAGGLVLYLSGATLNAMGVVGFVIALGVLIDDAIIDVENIMRRLRQYRADESSTPNGVGTPFGVRASPASIILVAATEMRGAAIYATLILLLAVSPIFFVQGLSGAFFQPVAVAYGLAVLVSMAVALTVTPALCLILFAKAPIQHDEPRLAHALQRIYAPLLSWVVQRPRWALSAGIGILLIGGLAAIPLFRQPQSLLPDFKERNLLIHLNTAPGTSQPEMSRISSRVSQELQTIPGVRSVGAHVGRAVMGDQVVNVSSAQLWVSIDPAADYDKTTTAIQTVIDGYPGLFHTVQTYLKEKSHEVVPEPKDFVVVRVYGDAASVLQAQAETVKKAIAGISGVAEATVKLPIQQPTLEVRVDLAAAQRYGIKPGDVRRAAATILSGIQVGSLFEEQKVFDVVVWGTPETRHSLSSIRDLPIDTPEGGHVRLGDVAEVSIVPAASIIRHEAVKRYIDVVADMQGGRPLDAVVADINSQLKQVKFPLEYHAEVQGQYAERGTAQTRLLIFACAAFIGVLFLLQAVLGKGSLVLFSVLTVLAAMAGGVLAAVIAGSTLSLGTLVGFLAVLGIAVRNQILLIVRYHHLVKYEPGTADRELVLRGTTERLVPILMTTFGTALVMLLALIMGDIPGLEIVRPMAIVILGGLVTSALVNLFIVPALFMRLKVGMAQDLDLAQSADSAEDDIFGGLAHMPGMAAGR